MYAFSPQAGLQAFGDMVDSLQQMTDVKTAYALVQFFTLILLLVRFVYHTSFQPKLSVIAGTLARFVPDILYYLVIFLTVSKGCCSASVKDNTGWKDVLYFNKGFQPYSSRLPKSECLTSVYLDSQATPQLFEFQSPSPEPTYFFRWLAHVVICSALALCMSSLPLECASIPPACIMNVS
eukprot:1155833-Pelagomonas_calceolata.AAC.2